MSLKKIIKFMRNIVFPIVLVLAVVLASAHFLWKGSGSNEWNLAAEEDGISVWTLKEPGSSLLKMKAGMRVDTSLSSAVFALRGDVSTAEDFTGTNFTVIEQLETPNLYMAYYSVNQVMPSPFGTKEIVMFVNYSQDKKSKKITMNALAAPSRIPQTNEYPRVKHLDNTFNLTPLPNGEIEWEMIMNIDIGIPYFLFNLAMPEEMIKEFKYLRELVKTDKYQQAEMVSVEEL
jgi:hypothetical protein